MEQPNFLIFCVDQMQSGCENYSSEKTEILFSLVKKLAHTDRMDIERLSGA